MTKKTDAIPLTTYKPISDDASAIESFQSVESVNNEGDVEITEVRRRPGGRRSLRVNSNYISQKNRFSRYKTALQTFIPLRTDGNTHSELPVDTVGCCSNLSFFWVRDFLLMADDDPMMDSSSVRKKHELNVMPTFNDRADVNGKRLLGIYKDEKQSKGKHGSMMKVAWNFCRTRVMIASIFYTLSTLSALCAPVIFLKMTLDSLQLEAPTNQTMTIQDNNAKLVDNRTESTVNHTISDIFKIIDFEFSLRIRPDCLYYMLGFAACFFASKIFASITNWLNLRTAIRLRTAVLSATFKKSIRSAIINNISTHQILTDDVEYMMDLVDYFTKILGTITALILSVAASIVLLSGPGVWPLFAAIGFFCVPVVLAKISTNRLRKSMHYLLRKMTVIESMCINFKDVMIHAMAYDYIKQFYHYNASQFAALRNAKIFSVHIYEGLTALLLGGLYLIWCDVDISTNSVETLVLVLVYVYFIKNFVTDYCHSMEAISNGQGSLEKLKNSFGMLVNPELSRVRTIDVRVLLSMTNCKFKWDEKAVFTIDVSRGEVLGVSGKHMKTLIYAILGHIECKDGLLRQRGVTGFFSEDPFICIGSIKDNILMGAEFDAKRYYTAVNSTKLNEDILQTLGADDLPIENLDLTKQQKQRIALARAIYSDRDIYLFDEPFKSAVFSSNVLQMFANVVHQIVSSDPNKAIIICSTNSQILNLCSKIYDTTENRLYSRADYERISAGSYHEGAVNYTFDNVKGCNQNGLTVYKMPSRFHVQIVHENQVPHHHAPPNDESTEHLISREKRNERFSIGCISLSFISILTFLNAAVYILLIIGFISVVKISYIEPWLEFVFFGGFILVFIIELIQKIYLGKLLEISQKKFHKRIFEKLLNTSLDYICGSNLADILNWFSITLYSQFEPYTKIVKSITIITLSGTFLLIINYWLTATVLLILIAGQVFSFHIIFKGRLKSTLNFYTLIEFESRKKMFQYMMNNLRGRDVIQSFDRTSEFCREFNVIIEDNSTAVFLQKSVKNYVSFILQMVIGLNVTLMHLLTLLMSPLSIYNYIFCIILYYLILHYTTELIVDGYIELLIVQCKRQLLESEVKSIVNNKQVSLLYEPSLPGEGGISIDFKDISVKLCGKKVLEISKLHIEKGDIIGITGNGSHLITSVLFKLLKPCLGVIFVGSQDLSVVSQDNLHSIIAVVPFDLHIQNLTIAEFLNPTNSVNHKTILNKLTLALPQVLQMPNKLQESVRSLNRQQKQLLCLVKASLKTNAKIVIFEFPEIEIQPTINLFIKRDLIEKTIIVIGTNHRHFETCNRIVNLDLDLKKK